ncbi:MAG: signal peptide peptidase SppA [Thermoguttaceae bacterium]|nr:signal peptide peptidase SppA [Thermoguttaceae bacterium]MBR0191516.1 signal peptide peptidase SppA [Thermoguttaceae bacterium]
MSQIPNYPPPLTVSNVPPVPRSRFKSGCACGCGTSLLIFFLILCFGLTLQSSSTSSANRVVISGPDSPFKDDCDKVAVIKINEAIMETDGFIYDQIEDVKEDSTVKAIVLRMDTPGGSVSASDYFYHKLTELRKKTNIPIVVSMGSVCASGGYYIAMSCGNENEGVLFAEPTTWTGSIGVIISKYDVSELAQKVGVKEDSIKSHELKGMGSMLRPMTEQEQTIFQALVNDAFGRFREVVYTGRKKFNDDHDALTPLATGQVFTTKDALESGLIDREGYLEDAINRAIEMAKLDREKTQVFTYTAKASLMDLVISSQEKLKKTEVKEIQEMAAPKALYLWQ